MHVYLWIVTSWLIVAVLCYLWLTIYGNGGAGAATNANGRRSTIVTKRTGEWFNEVIYWLWKSRRLSPAFADSFVKALNESFNRIGKTGNYAYKARFEFPLSAFTRANVSEKRASVRGDPRAKPLVVDEVGDAPYIEHVSASVDSGAGEHLILSGRLCVPKLTLKLNLADVLSDKTYAYELQLNNVQGEIEARVAQIADELFVMGCFSGRPTINVKILPADSEASAAYSTQELEELARRCILSAVLNFSLGEILYPELGRDSVRLSAEIRNLSMLNDFYALNDAQNKQQQQESQINQPEKQIQQQKQQQQNVDKLQGLELTRRKVPNRLIVRLIGAQNLGQNQGFSVPHRPYVSVEVDEPAQKFVSAPSLSGPNTHNPQWRDIFKIEINNSSKELLFEVHDAEDDGDAWRGDGTRQRRKSARKFLGLAIVGLDELARTASADSGEDGEPHIHQLALQARPYTDMRASESDTQANVVGGILVIQCHFSHVQSETNRPQINKFPTNETDALRGTLKNFDQNYIYNLESDPVDQINAGGYNTIVPETPKSPSNTSAKEASEWNFADKFGEILPNRSLSRSQSSHLNSSHLVTRPDSAFSRNTTSSQQQLPPQSSGFVASSMGRTDSRGSSSHHSSHLAPIQIPSQSQSPYNSQIHSSQASPYDCFDPVNRSNEKVQALLGPAPRSPTNPNSPTIPTSPTGSHVQFLNGKGDEKAPKRASPFRTTSETVVTGAEMWAPALHATSMAALGPIHPSLFDDAATRRGTNMSPQPPPVPPHHQSRYDEEQSKRAVPTNDQQPRRKESSSPFKSKQKSRRERSFFDNLRERLSRGATRSNKKCSMRTRSLDMQYSDFEEAAVSMPPSRDQSQVRTGITHHPEVISTSDSTQSASRIPRLGLDPNIRSKLVLEVVDNEDTAGERKTNVAGKRNKYQKFENNPYADNEDQSGLLNNDDDTNESHRMRYYLIPPEIANQPAAQALLRAGKKLHVFNQHTFVAVKPRGRVPCSVCARMITGNFTKQAYQCRDCRKVTHKSCHLRGTSPCHESNLVGMPIIDNVNWVEFLCRYQMQEFISMNGV